LPYNFIVLVSKIDYGFKVNNNPPNRKIIWIKKHSQREAMEIITGRG